VALDVGHDQLAWSIRSDPRVRVLEGLNARNLVFSDLGSTFDVITMDVSFISVTKIIPALLQFAKAGTKWVLLIKPQFEVGPEYIEKGGIVKNETVRLGIVAKICDFSVDQGLKIIGCIPSPLKGTDGNQEYLAHFESQ